MSLPLHTFSLPSFRHELKNAFCIRYICNYTTNVTLNDAVVANLYIFYHWALVKEYSKNIYIPDLSPYLVVLTDGTSAKFWYLKNNFYILFFIKPYKPYKYERLSLFIIYYLFFIILYTSIG